MGVEYMQGGQKKRVGGENFIILKMQCVGFGRINEQKTDFNFYNFVFSSV